MEPDEELDKQISRLYKLQTSQMLNNAATNKQEDQLIPLIIQQNTRLMELLVNLTEKIIMNKS
jgi:hypothetical protein